MWGWGALGFGGLAQSAEPGLVGPRCARVVAAMARPRGRRGPARRDVPNAAAEAGRAGEPIRIERAQRDAGMPRRIWR